MRKLSYEEILAKRPTLSELSPLDRFPIYCLVENVRSLYNVGSIFRTSDSVRLNKLYLTGYTGYPPRREIEKTALGATESVPWIHYPDTKKAITELKQNKVKLVALEHTSESKPYTEVTYNFPLCIMLGNEVDGLSESLVAKADQSIEIPMYGLKQSLNVSVAYGVVIFHILQQFQEVYKRTI
ncbi:RNA methyltransferase [Calditrichota bacterium]